MCLTVCPSRTFFKSFTYKLKSNGPRTEPCGTPRFVSSHSEFSLFSEMTIWVRFYRYDLIHMSAILEKPSCRSLLNSLVGKIVSKALLKSNNSSSVIFFLSIAMRMSSVIFINAVWVL